MGKATIISHLGDGQYSIKLNYHRNRIVLEITRLEIDIEVVDDAISQLDPTDDAVEIGVLRLRRTALESRIKYLNDLPADPVVSAWCADYTIDLSGEVGTVEIPGEYNPDFRSQLTPTDESVVIQPGYGDNAVYDQARDGQLFHVGGLPPEAAFYNLAMLPGWQKWMPTYRYGLITGIDHDLDTCDVALDTTRSSQQNLIVNESPTLTDVPIDYMSCDSAIFEVGDEVVVGFTDRDFDDPVVIGFKDNPRPCIFTFQLSHGDGTTIDQASGLLDYIKIYNSEGVLLSTTTTWNATTEKWEVALDDPADADSDGYWAEYNTTENGILTQYPYRYKTADKWNSADLISVGDYVDEIPYWEHEYTGIDGWPSGYTESDQSSILVCAWSPGGIFYGDIPAVLTGGVGYSIVCIEPDETTTRTLNVKSSVPYEVYSEFRNIFPQYYVDDCGYEPHKRCGLSSELNGTYNGSADVTGTELAGTVTQTGDHSGGLEGTQSYSASILGRDHTITFTDTSDDTIPTGEPDYIDCGNATKYAVTAYSNPILSFTPQLRMTPSYEI